MPLLSTTRVLRPQNSSTASGAIAEIWNWTGTNGTTSQQFVFTPVSGGNTTGSTPLTNTGALPPPKQYSVNWTIAPGEIRTSTTTITDLNRLDRMNIYVRVTPSQSFSGASGFDIGYVDVSTGAEYYFPYHMGDNGGSINSNTVVPMFPEGGRYRFRVRNRLPVPATITGLYNVAKPNAFSLEGGLENRTVTIQRIRGSGVTATTYENVWLPRILAARDSWNDSGAGVNITTTTGDSPHTLTVDSYAWDAWGRCIKSPWGDVIVTSGLIEINARTITSTLIDRQSTIAHEMGHLFWLGDNPATTQNSIMRYKSMDYDNIFTPQTYDVNNVRFIYG